MARDVRAATVRERAAPPLPNGRGSETIFLFLLHSPLVSCAGYRGSPLGR